MSIDQQLRDAGERLAERPVEVPDLDRLIGHRHRVRSFAMSGAIAALVAVVVIGVVAVDTPGDQTVAADGRRPVTTDPIGLAASAGIWPNDELLEPTVEETVAAFATEVLGWTDVSFDFMVTNTSGPNWVTLGSGDRSIRIMAAPTGGGWRLMQIGQAGGYSVEGSHTRLLLPPPPEDAVAVRWWAMADGIEHSGTHTDLGTPLRLPISWGRLVASLVVFVDADGRAIDAMGGDFGGSNEPRLPRAVDETDWPPTFRLALPDATLVRQEPSSPAVADMVVWLGTAEPQPYLSLNLRLASSGVDMAPTGFGPMTEDSDFPEDAGRAWFTTDTGERVASLRMWWVRPDGSVWLLTAGWPHAERGVAHADALDHMRAWAVAIEAPPSGDVADYELPLPGVERLAFDQSGIVRSHAEVWEYRNEEIVLSVTENAMATSLSNALDLDEVERISVAGELGWRGVDREGRTVVSWQHHEHAVWASLLIPASLADEVDEIVAAVERE